MSRYGLLRRVIPAVLTLFALTAVMWGCDDVPRSYRTLASATGTGQLVLNMGSTGASGAVPAPVSLFCTFESVRTFPVCPEACDPAELLAGPATLDVMNLQDPTTLATAMLEAGDYAGFSLRISGATALTGDGQEVDVVLCPESSGMEVGTLYTIEEDQVTEVRIDFDLSALSMDSTGAFVLCPQTDDDGNGDDDGSGDDDGNGDDGHGDDEDSEDSRSGKKKDKDDDSSDSSDSSSSARMKEDSGS